MAMGFAIASGLKPEQGIIAGAMACIIGRTFGGSKYQVYGPTAAFIPVLAGIMKKYGPAAGGDFATAHGILVLCSVIAGAILVLMGVAGLGRYANVVPNSIVVGFTVGIAVVIAKSNLASALASGYALGLALFTFVGIKLLLRISIFIPAPLLVLGACTAFTSTVLSGKGIALVGSIPTDFWVFTPPRLPAVLTSGLAFDMTYTIIAIVFVSAVESLLCSSMADRLAENKKTPFDPDKEFFGQGLVQILTPLLNGFPCTGALARTATSIKAGAVTPLAGYFKGFLKLGMAVYLAPYLSMIPMPCIAGILLWVASNMVKPAEIREVWHQGAFHRFLMAYCAVMVPATDFLTGVLSALIIFAVLRKAFEAPAQQTYGTC